MTEGLPADGTPGQFVGFNSDGLAYVIQWSPDHEVWLGAGFEPSRQRDGALPFAFVADGERANFIVSHAPLPA